MNGKDIELTRRRVLGGVATIGAASAAAGAGTFALFSDTESSQDNEVSAGTLNLQAGTSDPSGYGFTISNLKPGGSSDQSSVTLQNTGNITGTLTMDVSVTDSDGASPEAETGSVHDISTKIIITVSYGSTDITDSLDSTHGDGSGTLYLSELDGVNVNLDGTMTGGESNDLVITYELEDVGNDYQGDKSSVDLTFNLNQN